MRKRKKKKKKQLLNKLDAASRQALYDLALTWMIARTCRRLQLPISPSTPEEKETYRREIRTAVAGWVRTGEPLSGCSFRKFIRIYSEEIEKEHNRSN